MRRLASIVGVAAVALVADDTQATRNLPEYRYFRALSIDLQGRPPTLDELADFERPSFDLDGWIDAHLTGAAYTERVRRIYMDQLKLALAPTGQFDLPAAALQRAQVLGPHGAIDVYFRYGQRRANADVDGQLCFTEAEVGIKAPSSGSQIGTPKAISQELLDARTVEVKPWWLYADYRDAKPTQRITGIWAKQVMASLFVDADGKTPTTSVRVCKEEAQTAERGHVFVTGRQVSKGDPIPAGRLTRPPADTAFAKANTNGQVSCSTSVGFQSSHECGCGVGLERCLPALPDGFTVPIDAPLGSDEPFFSSPRPASAWLRSWWSEEAVHFLDSIIGGDRDFREVLTSRGTSINGPLAQFYRWIAPGTCCGAGTDLGYSEPEPLFDPASIPTKLGAEDTDWTWIADRGPHASGILTMPIFLIKYGSRRARAHVLYSTFLCRDFVSGGGKLVASSEPDLAKRPGCAHCHTRLEPMAAYFARVAESDWTYLPAKTMPVSSERCASSDPQKMRAACRTYYDPAFTDDKHATLRGAYASPAHAEAGPQGLAQDLVASPEYAPCVATTVAQSLLGRSLGEDDEAWKTALAKTFVDSGYRLRPLVRAILVSPQYRVIDSKGAP